MYSFINVEPIYTGGNIYVFLGKLDKNYFIASSANFDVRIIDIDPIKESDKENEEIWDCDWQEKHLIEDLNENQSLQFFENMIYWIQENSPSGNYLMSELDDLLNEIKDAKEERFENN